MEHEVSFEVGFEGETWCEEFLEISFEGRIGCVVNIEVSSINQKNLFGFNKANKVFAA